MSSLCCLSFTQTESLPPSAHCTVKPVTFSLSGTEEVTVVWECCCLPDRPTQSVIKWRFLGCGRGRYLSTYGPRFSFTLSCEVGKLCQGQTSGQSRWDKPSSSRSVSAKSWSYSKYGQPVSDHICTTMSSPPGALNMLSQLIRGSFREYRAHGHTCLPRLVKDSALRADGWLGVSASTQSGWERHFILPTLLIPSVSWIAVSVVWFII